MRSGSPEGLSWERVEEVLDRVLEDLPDTGASDFVVVSRQRLDELCGDDATLRHEVELLLAEAGNREDLFGLGLGRSLPDLLAELESDVGDSGLQADGDDSPSRVVGRTIDRYRLLELLGRGGMGVVYLAERADAQFEKRVALKVMPWGLESDEKERRFRTERQILARLEHENIARLLDGGVTDEGYPYLAMELVDGEAIDLYCERHEVPRRDRLLLFLDVCDAVRYAHENLVLHRDLKPGNILVTADRRVKLLDFGVGKILDDSGDEEGTRIQPMTPEYASPEQRDNGPVSTATDVYSLGLVLRRLVTGAKPSQMENPARPTLPADLRVILDKALRDSPGGRFRSVGEMAADLRRYLSGRPIESRPATLRYRLGKLVARHRLATVTALGVSLLLIAAVVAIAWQGRVARQERDRARQEAQKAQTVAELLGGLFEAADPNSPSAGQLSARDLLERGEMRVQEELAEQPEVRSELLAIMGSAHAGLGDNSRGAELLERAVAEHRARRPVDDLALADALRRLAVINYDEGEVATARAQLEEAMELLRRNGALDSKQAGETLLELGRVEIVARRHDDAGSYFRAALRVLEQHGDEVDAAITKTDLAIILDRTGRQEDALRLQQEALETLLAARGEGHPMVSATRNNIAITLYRMGDYVEAERLFRGALAAGERVYGADHPALSDTLSNLGKLLMDRGRFEQAAPFVRRAAELRRATYAPDNYNRIAAEMNLGALDLLLGNVDEAVALYGSGLERLEGLTGAESAPSMRARGLLGVALHRAGDVAAAERLLRDSLQADTESVPPVHRAELLVGLGAVLADRGRAEEAEPLVRDALALYLGALPADNWKVNEARLELAGSLLRKDRRTDRDGREAAQLLALASAGLQEEGGIEWLRTRAATFRELATP